MNMLQKVELFKCIEKNELNKMLNCLRPSIKTYKKNEYIKIQSDDLSAIGIVLQGEAVITKETFNGDRSIIARVSKGNAFGELEAFSGTKSLSTVVAVTDCIIFFLPVHKIVGVCPNTCSGHKFLVQNILRIISQEALILNKKLEIISLKSIRKKVSTYLLEQYFMKNSLSFEIPLKRNELAEYLIASRPSLSRELIKMREEGIIDFSRNSFSILNLEALKECQ